MSRNSYKNQRRSALSFAGGDDSLDRYIDNIVESDPWKNVEEIEKSEAAHIQNMLNEFDNIISQQKAAKAGHNGTKRKSKQPTQNSTAKFTENIVESNDGVNAIEIENNDPARIQHVLNDFDDKITQQKTPKAGHSGTRRKSTQATEKSAITDSMTINSEGSSNMHSNIDIPKSKDQKRKKPSPKQSSKTVEKMSLSELQHNVDDAKRASQKASEPNVNEITVNKSVKEDKKDVTNTDMNLLTSTPKIKVPKTKGEMAKNKKSIVRKRKPKITDSEIKPEENINCEEKKRRKRTSKKNAKEIEHCQGEDNKNIPVKEENISNMEEQKNDLECNKENGNTLKSEAKQKKVKSNGETKLPKNKKKCNAVGDKCKDKNMNIGNKLEKDVKNKLPKGVKSNKSSKLKNNVENTESQCKKDCAKNCGKYEQRLLRAKEKSEERKEHRKSKKAAKAMAKLSCQMSIVQKKMECIKINLENSESSTSSIDYSDESYSSSYSSSSSGSSHSSDCSCSDCYYYYTSDDYTDYTSDSSTYSENSGDENKNKNKNSESKISR